MAKEQLIIELIAETKNAVKNLKTYTGAAKKSSDRIGKLTKLVKGYFAELTAGIMVARKIIKSVQELSKAYGIQELAVVNLESALRATGTYTPQLSAEMQDLASSLQDVTTYGDEATLEAAALLQSLADLNAEGLKQSIPLLLDFAAGMKIDLNTAASLVGKTLGSTTNALSRYGIVLDATADQQTKIAQLQDAMTEKFGGRAIDQAQTYSGQVINLKNNYGDLKEQLGFLTTQNMPAFVDLTNTIIDKMSGWIGKIIAAKQEVANFRKALGGMSEDELKALMAQQDEYIQQLADTIAPMIKQIEYLEGLKRRTRDQKKELKALREQYEKLIPTYDDAIVKMNDYRKALANIKTTNEDVIETNKEMAESLGWLTKAHGLFKFEMIDEERARRKANKQLTEWNQLTKQAIVLADDFYGNYDTNYTPAVKTMTLQQALLNDASGVFQNTLISMVDAADNSKNALRDMAKVGLSSILRALGEILIAQAVLNWFAPWRAIAMALAGAAAIAASNYVARMQQGGEVQHLQTGGFGDRQPAMLEQGEVVINKFDAQKNAAGIGRMRSGENGGGQTINLILDGRKLASWIYKASTNKVVTISAKAVV